MEGTASYPVFLKLRYKKCVVAGGGEVALRKIEGLLKAEAAVTVVAPQLCDQLVQMVQQQLLQHRQKLFSSDDLDDTSLVIAATEKRQVNLEIYQQATARGILVNVVDDPELCTFTTPAVINRAPLTVAIASGGAAPMLVRSLREKLEAIIPGAYGEMAQLMQKTRSEVSRHYPDLKLRRRFWQMVLSGAVAELVNSGRLQEAEQKLHDMLRQQQVDPSGEVYLVGGGPGDPDLLTFKAMRLMQQADVVVYDRLVAPEILELVRRDAKRVYVGKEKDVHTVPQEEINKYLVQRALEGNRVLRLKGGDPFIFGRGGEEISELAKHKVPFHIVPGITAASGCAAYAGIPLTHRDYANSCVFVTGHATEQKQLQLNWESLVQPRQTIAVYMGVHSVAPLSQGLIEHGMNPDMPAAIIQQGTTNRQKVYTATISTLPQLAQEQQVKAPSMIIVGEVVKLRASLYP